MAASMKICLRNGISFCRTMQLINRRVAVSAVQKCEMSSSSGDDRYFPKGSPLVGMSKDGQTLVCWHPEPEHPYEHTSPIRYDEREAAEGSMYIKEQVLRDYDMRMRPQGPNIAELSNITFTTKHQWFPHKEKTKRKKNEPKDRDHI